jgi:hypothetical protein
MTRQIDEIRLQRLVDNALGDDERREFLVELDNTPELWREVALAFVEDQILCSELCATRRSQDIAGTMRKGRRISPAASALIALAIAASLLATFGIGFRWGQWQVEPPMAPVVPRLAAVSEPNGESEDVEATRDEPRAPESAFRLVLARQDGETVELPVYERSQLADLPWGPADMRRLQRLNETLVQRGYRADMRTEYLSGRLDDGRQIVVPRRTVSLRYDAQ